MSKGRPTRKRAIRDTLHRLGLQARPAEVVAALAACGISVGEEQVRAVLLGMLRRAASADRHRSKARTAGSPPPVRRFAKVPPRRNRRR